MVHLTADRLPLFCRRWTALLILIGWICIFSTPADAQKITNHTHQVPRYILNGLQTYESEGYEAAVHKWFEGSPWANAGDLVARIAFLKNIEMLYGKYTGYDIITTKQTPSSQITYVRFNYERMSGYALFTSSLRNKQWVLSHLDLHKMQKFADTP